MGLHSMSHRAEAIGAFLSIHPRDGGGTVVRCALPEPTPAADSEPA
jgi:signal transduction histidine kinase